MSARSMCALWSAMAIMLMTSAGCESSRPIRLANSFKDEPIRIVDWARSGNPADGQRLIDAAAAYVWMDTFGGSRRSSPPTDEERSIRRDQLAIVSLRLVELFLAYEDREDGDQLWLGEGSLGPMWGFPDVASRATITPVDALGYRSLRDEITDPRMHAWWWNAGVQRGLIDSSEIELRPDPWPASIPDPFGETDSDVAS